MRLYFNGLILCLLFMQVFPLAAAPMDGEPIQFTQPNGKVIHLKVFGDEFYAETRTLDGYTVFFDTVEKAYYYAVLSADGNEFLSSGVLVGIGKPPIGLPKKLTIRQESKQQKIRNKLEADEFERERAKRWKSIKAKTRDRREKKKKLKDEPAEDTFNAEDDPRSLPAEPAFAPPSSETTGVRVGLTIMVEFPDVAGSISPTEVDNYCNQVGYSGYENDGSVYDYFHTQSEGKLRYYNVVTPYVMAPHPKSYYDDTSKSAGYCGRLLLNDILQELIAGGFDFSKCTVNASGRLHAINVFFAGSSSGVWSYGLWPHKSGLSPDVDLGNGVYADQYQITNLGSSLRLSTFCHENGHLLVGFPDLYDYDTGADDSRGVGRYSLMASSGYSTHPTSVDGYLRYHAGWVEIIDIPSAGHFRGSVRVDYGSLYQFMNGSNPEEYFMLENRAKIGWEAGANLPDQGLNIMHCDEGGNHNSQEMTSSNHFEVSIEQADGLFQLEYNINSGGSGDLFHFGDVDQFNDSTLPNAHWWANATTNPASGDSSGFEVSSIGAVGETMTFMIGSGSLSGSPVVGVDRTLLSPRAFSGQSPAEMKFAVWNQSGGTLSYSVSSPTSWISLSSSNGTASIESDVITITYDTVALGSGTHYGQIVITNTAEPSDFHIITVELTIEADPLLSSFPSSITITGAVGSLSKQVILLVDNIGGSEMEYSISGPSWLTASSSSGEVTGEADAILIGFDGSGMAEGDYSGTLTVTAPDAINSPITIPLTFAIRELVLTAPQAGQYVNSESISIEWVSSSAVYPFVDIELWRDGQQKVVIADNTPNDGSHLWTVPEELTSASNYTIRVSVEGGASYKESGPLGVWVYSESFESDFGTWFNRTDDDSDWSRRSGATPSSNTGPAGASDRQSYVYTEASGTNFPDKVMIISNSFLLSELPEAAFTFDYHMYGSSMGSLHLDAFDGVTYYPDVWAATGQQHYASEDSWTTATIDLSPYTAGETIHLQFRGITGSGFRSDMAIDNIHIANWTEILLTNNVPASWMTGFGLTADDASALLDSDGDGLSNWAEYYAGTSPVDADSVLEMKDAERGPEGLVITWSAVYGKSYTVMSKQNLVFGNWITEDTGISGIEPLCTYTVSTDHATGFISIELEQ